MIYLWCVALFFLRRSIGSCWVEHRLTQSYSRATVTFSNTGATFSYDLDVAAESTDRCPELKTLKLGTSGAGQNLEYWQQPCHPCHPVSLPPGPSRDEPSKVKSTHALLRWRTATIALNTEWQQHLVPPSLGSSDPHTLHAQHNTLTSTIGFGS